MLDIGAVPPIFSLMLGDSAQPAPPEWLDALAEGQADLAADDATPWPEARSRLVSLQDELKAKQTCRRA